MSIDISSMIPVINAVDVRTNKQEENNRITRPVEESSDSGNAGLHLNGESSAEMTGGNIQGVGDTYSTRGELIKETNIRQNGDNKNTAIDMVI